MSLHLLKKANVQGVSISLNNGNLRVETGGKPLPADLRAELVANKAELIALLETADLSGIKPAQTKITPVVNRDKITFPLSYSQQRLWFIDRLNNGSPEYNMIGAFNIGADFDVNVAESAICKIIERHQILRTVYTHVEGETHQRVKKDFSFTINKFDLSQCPAESKTSKLNKIIDSDASKPFLLSEDLMIRVNFVLLGDTGNEEYGVLTINIHHIASDGWSIDIFLQEFVEVYKALSTGDEPTLPDLPLQYKDFASWQKEFMSKTQLGPQLMYWDKQLRGLPYVHNLPLCFPRGEVKNSKGEMLTSSLKKDHADRLASIAKDLKMTPFMLVHAALALILSNYSKRQDIVIGTPIANRKQSDLDNLIGFFSNSLPLRVSTAYQSLNGYLLHVRKTHIDAQENQDVPFEQLVERQKLARDMAFTPLFQVMLASEMDYGVKAVAQGPQKTLGEVGLKKRKIAYTASKFDLDINVVFGKKGIQIYWLYDTALFQKQFIEQLQQHLVIALDNLSHLGRAEHVEKMRLQELLAYCPSEYSYSENHHLLLQRGDGLPVFPVNIQCGDDTDYRPESNTLDKQIDYWSKQLAEAPHVHGLADESGRRNSFRLAQITGKLPDETVRSLSKLAERHQLTQFMLFHAALALVVSRHSNSHDIVIGTPIGHSAHRALTPYSDLFVNTLPLRIDTSHKILRDYLAHVREVNLFAQQNQNVPFEQLIAGLQIPLSSEYRPLVQIILTTNPVGRVSNTSVARKTKETKCYDLHVSFSSMEKYVVIEWEYNDRLFQTQFIEQLNAHLCQALISLSQLDESAPDAQLWLRDVEMLSPEERNDLIYLRNDTQSDYHAGLCIHELFELQVKQHPASRALVFEDQQLTYQQLNDKANQLAHFLREDYNVRPESIVGLCLERSMEMVICVLAVLKAGGAYVPLDPGYPQERLRYMLSDSGASVVLAHQSTKHVLSGFNGKILTIDSIANDNRVFAKYSTVNIAPATIDLAPNNLAYVIYTSGSTGNPKGVMLEHLNTLSMLHWANLEYDEAVLSRTLASTSLSFDLSVFEMFAPLSTGGCCVIVKDILDVSEKNLDITLINTVPSAINALLEHNAIPYDIKCINLAGEPLHTELVNELLSKTHDARVYNLYGPTEDTTYSTYLGFSATITEPMSIGKVLMNSQVYILDDALGLTPFGSQGELYLAGSGVARGYFEQPALTAERFIDNPYYDPAHSNSPKRLYKTGDVVRYMPDGNLEYVGRLDEQVKIRGFRIELGDINAQLHRFDTVDSALVLAKPVAGNLELVAYIKPTMASGFENKGIYAKTIKAELSTYLPDYMVPAIIMLLDTWPLTPNGKIDKNALPAPDAMESQGEYVSPQNETERKLTLIWGKLLQIDSTSISTTADFFELGLSSLKLFSCVANLNKEFDVSLSIREIYEHSSVILLGEKIRELQLVNRVFESESENSEFFQDGEI